MKRPPEPTPPWPVHIGQAAAWSGVTPKMIRHYEKLGLLASVHRSDSGYRLYSEADVHTLRFIKRARDLGFAMRDIAGLLSLWHDRKRSSAQVKRIAQRHLAQLRERIEHLQAIERSLQQLSACCHGDDRPDCPILDDLAR